MKRRTRKSTLTDPLFPCPTRFRSSSDAARRGDVGGGLCRIREERKAPFHFRRRLQSPVHETLAFEAERIDRSLLADRGQHILQRPPLGGVIEDVAHRHASHTSASRSEEHTSELQSLMRSSYDVFCLKNKKKQNRLNKTISNPPKTNC